MKTNANHTNANANANANMENIMNPTVAHAFKTAAMDVINNVKNPDNTRKSYRFMNRRNAFDATTEKAANAALDIIVAMFAIGFDGTAYEVKDVRCETVTSKKGVSTLRVVVVPAHLDSKGIYLTCNTTASLDMTKLATNYVKRWDKLYSKAIENGTPAAIEKREHEKAVKRVEREIEKRMEATCEKKV